MGQGEESKADPETPVEIQERGEIFFFYRPKVGKEEAHGAEEVQHLYIVLRPESGERPVEEKQHPASGKEGAKKKKTTKKKDGETSESSDSAASEGGHGSEKVNIEHQTLLRFIVMGRKSLPPPTQRGRPFWGYVEMVTTKIEEVKAALQGEEYDTSARGRRHKPAARALGEGVYRILRHNPGRRMHTHLIYKLEFPLEGESGDPQETFNIKREGSFLIQIKNPEQPGSSQFRGLQSKRKAMFPAHLQGQFGQRRFHPADPPAFLNYEGCEFLLIAASDDIEGELGVELRAEEGEPEPACSDLVKTFGETASIAPLLKGTWA